MEMGETPSVFVVFVVAGLMEENRSPTMEHADAQQPRRRIAMDKRFKEKMGTTISTGYFIHCTGLHDGKETADVAAIGRFTMAKKFLYNLYLRNSPRK